MVGSAESSPRAQTTRTSPRRSRYFPHFTAASGDVQSRLESAAWTATLLPCERHKRLTLERPRHILVVIDPTATQQPALERARILALAFDARLELFVCHVAGAAGEVRIDELRLEELANGLREQGIETSTEET